MPELLQRPATAPKCPQQQAGSSRFQPGAAVFSRVPLTWRQGRLPKGLSLAGSPQPPARPERAQALGRRCGSSSLLTGWRRGRGRHGRSRPGGRVPPHGGSGPKMLPGAGPSGTERCTSRGGGGGLRSPRRPRRARPRLRLPPRSPRAGGEPRLGEGKERNAAGVKRCGLSGGSLGTGARSALAGAPCRREERLPSSATARAV